MVFGFEFSLIALIGIILLPSGVGIAGEARRRGALVTGNRDRARAMLRLI
jgi:hypothetical protein